MNNLVPLHFESHDIRMVWIDEVPWWVLMDVARAFGKINPAELARKLDDDEKGISFSDTLGGKQGIIIVNEPGLLKIILRSQDAIRPGTFAHRFCRWVTHEVLPTIRKWGQYPAPEVEASDWNSYGEGARKSLPERFREERLRWEQDNPGYSLADIPSFSPSIVRAIESGMGGLYRGRRIEMLTKAGIDTQYVMIGRYTVTPAERRMLARSRAMQAEHRLAASVAVHEIEGPEA